MVKAGGYGRQGKAASGDLSPLAESVGRAGPCKKIAMAKVDVARQVPEVKCRLACADYDHHNIMQSLSAPTATPVDGPENYRQEAQCGINTHNSVNFPQAQTPLDQCQCRIPKAYVRSTHQTSSRC